MIYIPKEEESLEAALVSTDEKLQMDQRRNFHGILQFLQMKLKLTVLFFVSLAVIAVTARVLDDTNVLRASRRTRSKIASGLPVKLLCVGDSMSDLGYTYYSASRVLMTRMRNVYRDGGQGLDGWYIGGNQPPLMLERAKPPGFFFSVSPVLSPGEEIDCAQASPDYYLETSYWMATNSYNKVGLFWYSYPGGGSFNVGVTNDLTQMAELPTIILSGYSATPTIQYTNWPVSASGYLNMRVMGVSGTNFMIGPEMANTNAGVEVFFFAEGGTGLTQWLSLGTNLLGQLWSEVSPDLVIYHAKDYGPPPDLPGDFGIISSNFTAFISTLTNVTRNIVVVGTPPAEGDGEIPIQNEAEKAVADANSFGFLDLYQAFPDFDQNQTAGLMRDPTHPSALGASIWADEMARQLGFVEAESPNFGTVTRNGQALKVSWRAISGKLYFLEYKTDLSDQAWTQLGPAITATNNPMIRSIPLDIQTPSREFRIGLLP